MIVDHKRLTQQIAFIECLDRLKRILRQNLVMDESRRENSAEHSWHAAMVSLILAEYAPGTLDQCRVLKMLLLHDVVEIEAGDTFCFDAEANRDKAEREQRAAAKLFGLLPADLASEMRCLWEEFETGQTSEARYANCLDRFQVLLQNVNTRGGTWRIHGITRDQVMQRMLPIREGLPALWPVVEDYIEQGCSRGWIRDSARA
ncbi:MAG: HD domain-containing protein [Desulfuromonadales bacterium]|jgi:putative hydrolases of HD superfamily